MNSRMPLKVWCMEKDGIKGIMPEMKTIGAACADIATPYSFTLDPQQQIVISMLVAFDIPVGYCLYMMPRSSLFSKYQLLMPTSVIDSDYKKDIHGMFYNMSNQTVTVYAGARVAQIMFAQAPIIQLSEVDNIAQNGRGGLGSTGV